MQDPDKSGLRSVRQALNRPSVDQQDARDWDSRLRVAEAEGMIRFTHGITDHFRVRKSEWVAAGAVTTWGIVLLGPSNVLDTPSWESLSWWGSQKAWGAVALTLGITRLTALAVNGAFKPTALIRTIMAMVCCFFWFLLTMSVTSSGAVGTALSAYPYLLLLDALNTMDAAGDAGKGFSKDGST